MQDKLDGWMPKQKYERWILATVFDSHRYISFSTTGRKHCPYELLPRLNTEMFKEEEL